MYICAEEEHRRAVGSLTDELLLAEQTLVRTRPLHADASATLSIYLYIYIQTRILC